MHINNITAAFTRPNNTTAYATGQLVANSTTAGAVLPMTFALGNTFGVGSFRLTRARLSKNGTGVANASFRIMLYQPYAPSAGGAAPLFVGPPVSTVGDGSTYSTSGAATWLGNIDVTSMLAHSDGACGTGSFPAGSEGFMKLAGGVTLYAYLMAQGGYTPIANEVFTLTLEELDSY